MYKHKSKTSSFGGYMTTRTEKSITKYWNSYFMSDVSFEVKCVGRLIINKQDVECPSNDIPHALLSWERDHIESKFCNGDCDWHTIKDTQFQNNSQHTVSNMTTAAPLEIIYNELINKVRILCPSCHISRKDNPRRDRTHHVVGKKTQRLKDEFGIKIYIPTDSQTHKDNVKAIKKIYKRYQNKPIPDYIFGMKGRSQGVEITPKLIMRGIELRKQGFGSYKIADKLNINVNTVKRYIPVLSNLLLLKHITQVDGVKYA